MRTALSILISLLALVGQGSAGAEVIDSGAHGFTSRNVAVIAAEPLRVYAILVDSVDLWWSPDHTFSGNAMSLSIDAEAGGCFCERLPGGGIVEHLTVVHASPGRLLRLRGALGPLQSTAVVGTMSWTLEPSNGGTRVSVTYTVGGYVPGGLDAWAPAVDRVVGEQLQRFARYAATGNADAPPEAAGNNSDSGDR
jgi:uncharacterized protein YndB with AHSA1/START domain